MRFLYTIGIYLYQFGLGLAAPFHAKARAWVRGRRRLFEQLKTKLSTENQRPTAWFHAASMGEFEQGRPLIEAFRTRYPDYRIVLTFFSPSGYEIRKNYAGVDLVSYLPADTPANARQFLDLVSPQVAFFIKYEFWHNHITELHARQIPVFSVASIFRADQVFFGQSKYFFWTRFFQSTLQKFTHHFVQNQESLRLLRSIGIENVTRAGDTRFDRVQQLAAVRKAVPVVADFKKNQPVLIVGSAWEADMQVIIPFLNHFSKPLKVIIAPHEINLEEIENWQKQMRVKSIKYSEILDSKPIDPNLQVLFIDNIGLLSSLYQYADFAYVGGAFGKGLHNILEAATFGLPLIFGNKNYQKFQEANDLVALGGAFVVKDTDELTATFNELYHNANRPKSIRETTQKYVDDHTGATQIVLDTTARWL